MSDESWPRRAAVVGASGGIGRALVEALRPRTQRLFAISRNPSGEEGDGVRRLKADATRDDDLERIAGVIRDEADELDLVVTTIGVLHDESRGLAPEKSLSEVQVDRIARVVEINALAPLLVAKHLGPLLVHRQRSVLAALSARVGSIGDNRMGGWYGYRLSKAALNQAYRTVAVEFGRRRSGPIVVTLHPGTVDTPLSEPFQGNVPSERLFTRDRAAGQLLDVIDGLTDEDSGQFFAWDGQRIEW